MARLLCRKAGSPMSVLEDIASAYQRPKLDDLGAYIYLVFHQLQYNEPEQRITRTSW